MRTSAMEEIVGIMRDLGRVYANAEVDGTLPPSRRGAVQSAVRDAIMALNRAIAAYGSLESDDPQIKPPQLSSFIFW
jgi:hypothetical protein